MFGYSVRWILMLPFSQLLLCYQGFTPWSWVCRLFVTGTMLSRFTLKLIVSGKFVVVRFLTSLPMVFAKYIQSLPHYFFQLPWNR